MCTHNSSLNLLRSHGTDQHMAVVATFTKINATSLNTLSRHFLNAERCSGNTTKMTRAHQLDHSQVNQPTCCRIGCCPPVSWRSPHDWFILLLRSSCHDPSTPAPISAFLSTIKCAEVIPSCRELQIMAAVTRIVDSSITSKFNLRRYRPLEWHRSLRYSRRRLSTGV